MSLPDFEHPAFGDLGNVSIILRRLRQLEDALQRAAADAAQVAADQIFEPERDQEREDLERHEIGARIGDCGQDQHGGGGHENQTDQQADDAEEERAQVAMRARDVAQEAQR